MRTTTNKSKILCIDACYPQSFGILWPNFQFAIGRSSPILRPKLKRWSHLPPLCFWNIFRPNDFKENRTNGNHRERCQTYIVDVIKTPILTGLPFEFVRERKTLKFLTLSEWGKTQKCHFGHQDHWRILWKLTEFSHIRSL